MNHLPQDDDLLFLYKSLLNLRTPDECDAFLEDLCTISELKAMVQRLAVARLLHSGKTYTDISVETGASAATISRVNRALEYGSGGYKVVLKRLQGSETPAPEN